METSWRDREDYAEDQEIKLENKEEHRNPAYGNTEVKENETEPEKDRLKRTKTGIVFDRDALMDKEQRLPSCAQELRGARRAIARRLS